MSVGSATRYFFCASHESICDLTRKGIWHDMPLNHELDSIDPSTVMIVNKDDKEINATDVKLEKYVRVITDPASYLAKWKGNIASVFVVEVDPKLLQRVDVLKISRIRDRAVEYLKNIMVDLSFVRRVYVYSKAVEQQLRKVVPKEQQHISIVVDSKLFIQEGSEMGHFDENFTIKAPSPVPIPSVPSSSSPDMIKICKGDLLKSSMQTHVNTVNCVGVMGKGIALAFKNQYPAMFKDYVTKCKKKEVRLGFPYCFPLVNNRMIVNFPTKGHWKENSNKEKIEEGLQYLIARVNEWKIQSIAFPPLGCGNGNLNWDVILPLMRKYLSQMGIPVEIYVPHEAYSFGQSIQSSQSTSTSKRKADQEGSTSHGKIAKKQ
jgi:O-acetyl-ADP-ribose deacetylase (regulator of RNase III)